jgi:ribosomal protein S18 acetylase RimI-like enzyme
MATNTDSMEDDLISIYLCEREQKNQLEKYVCDLCCEYFCEKEPYNRIPKDTFINDTLTELRNGSLYLAQNTQDNICGICVVCSPDLDSRVKSYAEEHKCNIYLAVLIIKEGFRRRGYAKQLLRKAFQGQNETERVILITPERNIQSIELYKSLGMSVVGDFEQTENSFSDGHQFNLHRVVIAGDVAGII